MPSPPAKAFSKIPTQIITALSLLELFVTAFCFCARVELEYGKSSDSMDELLQRGGGSHLMEMFGKGDTYSYAPRPSSIAHHMHLCPCFFQFIVLLLYKEYVKTVFLPFLLSLGGCIASVYLLVDVSHSFHFFDACSLPTPGEIVGVDGQRALRNYTCGVLLHIFLSDSTPT